MSNRALWLAGTLLVTAFFTAQRMYRQDKHQTVTPPAYTSTAHVPVSANARMLQWGDQLRALDAELVAACTAQGFVDMLTPAVLADSEALGRTTCVKAKVLADRIGVIDAQAQGVTQALRRFQTTPLDRVKLDATAAHWRAQIEIIAAIQEILAVFATAEHGSRIVRDEVIDMDSEGRHRRGKAYDAFSYACRAANEQQRILEGTPYSSVSPRIGPLPTLVATRAAWTDEERHDRVFFERYREGFFRAIGFDLGQRISMERLERDAPAAAQPVRMSYAQLVARYAPAITAIRRRAPEWGITAEQMDAVLSKAEADLRTALEQGDLAALVRDFPSGISTRLEQGYDQEPHRLLIAMHPTIQDHPEEEFNWHWTKTIDVAHYPKLHGHRPNILIPSSWTVEEGKGAHVAITCSDPRLQSLAMVGVRVLPPLEMAATVDEVFAAMGDGLAEVGCEQLAMGATKVDGNQARWWFMRGERVKASHTAWMRMLFVVTISRGSVYTFTFRTDSQISDDNAAHRWARHQALFAHMLSVWVLD